MFAAGDAAPEWVEGCYVFVGGAFLGFCVVIEVHSPLRVPEVFVYTFLALAGTLEPGCGCFDVVICHTWRAPFGWDGELVVEDIFDGPSYVTLILV